MTHPEQWPLRHLVLRTPRIELRPDDDAGLFDLVEVGYQGVHPPDEMPFLVPWTEADPAYMGRGTLQHFWSQRAEFAPEKWALHFLVRVDGKVVGVQSVMATDFAVTREVSTGSWLGLAHQRRGIGTEMRAAVLLFAFDHLGATRARSGAFTDNRASHRVSEKLGYRPDGTNTYARRGERVEEVRLLLTPEAFAAHRPTWTLEADGVEDCAALLGA
ncbi:GNAT family N-acetyltransferase [Pseudonocardia bannensis]|uniref:GNAT family N-acetyltransferase n=1 Tax=Pseudonocardia bannensis TaxID=630973 RepID=A0A848DC81_9PSEU|nr:GNAT family protein [Pseudonocardia bannensis]NMH90116.1 GNAT family N-acetyltransferase [Pseudonocardia bannensis]